MMKSFKVFLMLSMLTVAAQNCYATADHNIVISNDTSMDIQKTKDDNESSNILGLDDLKDSSPTVSAPKSTELDYDKKTIKNKVVTPVDSEDNITEPTVAPKSDNTKSDSVFNDNDYFKKKVLGSVGSTLSNQVKYNLSNVLNQNDQDQIGTLIVKAVEGFDVDRVITPFKTAHTNYKQSVAAAEQDGEKLGWKDKGWLGLQHYGGAYFNVMVDLASETIKFAGPIIAKMLVTALIVG